MVRRERKRSVTKSPLLDGVDCVGSDTSFHIGHAFHSVHDFIYSAASLHCFVCVSLGLGIVLLLMRNPTLWQCRSSHLARLVAISRFTPVRLLHIVFLSVFNLFGPFSLT